MSQICRRDAVVALCLICLMFAVSAYLYVQHKYDNVVVHVLYDVADRDAYFVTHADNEEWNDGVRLGRDQRFSGHDYDILYTLPIPSIVEGMLLGYTVKRVDLPTSTTYEDALAKAKRIAVATGKKHVFVIGFIFWPEGREAYHLEQNPPRLGFEGKTMLDNDGQWPYPYKEVQHFATK